MPIRDFGSAETFRVSQIERFPAGAETTRSAIGDGLLALTENPDEMKRLRENPTLIKTAIEEIVRWTSPSLYKRRTASRDTELRGIPIRKGQG
jgi:cytochrome P450